MATKLSPFETRQEVVILSTTPSEDCHTGALVVNGGCGIVGDLYVCGNINGTGGVGTIGPTGPTGPAGTNGVTGPTGWTGWTGPSGGGSSITPIDSNFALNDTVSNLALSSVTEDGSANIRFVSGNFSSKFGVNEFDMFEWGGASMSGGRLYLDSSGNITAAGLVTAYSDKRLKTNLKVIEHALDKVIHLTGYEYDRIDKETHEIGLVAQEVQEIIPEVVLETQNAQKYLSINYGNLVALLIEAIKELNDKVDGLHP